MFLSLLIWLVGLCLACFVVYTAILYLKLIWPSRDGLPEARASWFFGHAPYMWNKDHEQAMWNLGKHIKEKIFNVRLMQDAEFAVVTSANFANALLTQPTLFGRSYKFEKILPPAAGSVLDTELADHQWQRLLLARAFTPESLRKYMPVFCTYSKEVCQVWKSKLHPGSDLKIDVQSYMADMTFDMIGECAFGYKFNSMATAEQDDANEVRVRRAFRSITELQGKYENRVLLALFPILFWLPFGPAKAFRQSSKLMDSTISKIIKQRREDMERGGIPEAQERNILSILLRARESDARMTDKLIAANIFIFMIAGHETTASTLTWLMLLLAQNPKCQDKIKEEIEEVLPNGCEVSYEGAMKLHYTAACVKEALRLFPPVLSLGRTAKEATKLGDHALSKGKLVGIWLQFIHHDENIYPEPHLFKPERWLRSDAGTVPGGFLPFSIGPHECIGKKFAMLEMKTFLVYLLRNFRLESDPNFKNYRIEVVLTRKVYPPVSVKLALRDDDGGACAEK